MGESFNKVAAATLVVALITAAGVFSLYTGAAPVARVTLTTTSVSTQTSVTTLPVQIVTQTTTLQPQTSTVTSIATLPAQIVSVTQTSTATSVLTSSVTTTSMVTNASEIARLQALLNLSNKTVLLNNFKATIGPGTPCSYYPGCINSNQTLIIQYDAKYAGFLVVSASMSGPCCPLGIQVEFQYSSIANSLACGVNVSCSSGYASVGVEGATQTTIVPTLPGYFKVVLYNWSNQTQSATVSVAYYD